MKDFSNWAAYSDRHMITGWYDNDGEVIEVQAFYCTNGPNDDDGQFNVREAGVIKPGPQSTTPYYFVPEAGYSVNPKYSLFKTREDAVTAARKQLEARRDAINERLAALDA